MNPFYVIGAAVILVVAIFLIKRAHAAAIARHAAEQPPAPMEVYNLPPGQEPSAPNLQELDT